ncbi:hypothetical protein HHK36_003023 [Tetracentron sinense]|uniref:Uncharacterized protein n=1 Tax=Tetracentron sinense TaxID=13715 RepID=A0A834ZNC6_TETSI|nr:hypothetical protein HHK36_003023 [Tetracentron sinense]
MTVNKLSGSDGGRDKADMESAATLRSRLIWLPVLQWIPTSTDNIIVAVKCILSLVKSSFYGNPHWISEFSNYVVLLRKKSITRGPGEEFNGFPTFQESINGIMIWKVDLLPSIFRNFSLPLDFSPFLLFLFDLASELLHSPANQSSASCDSRPSSDHHCLQRARTVWSHLDYNSHLLRRACSSTAATSAAFPNHDPRSVKISVRFELLSSSPAVAPSLPATTSRELHHFSSAVETTTPAAPAHRLAISLSIRPAPSDLFSPLRFISTIVFISGEIAPSAATSSSLSSSPPILVLATIWFVLEMLPEMKTGPTLAGVDEVVAGGNEQKAMNMLPPLQTNEIISHSVRSMNFKLLHYRHPQYSIIAGDSSSTITSAHTNRSSGELQASSSPSSVDLSRSRGSHHRSSTQASLDPSPVLSPVSSSFRQIRPISSSIAHHFSGYVEIGDLDLACDFLLRVSLHGRR